MGISLFSRKRKAEAAPKPGAAGQAGQAAKADGPERLTANDWAKKFGTNEVMAERAAMRAGKWHDTFTEEEFLELLKRVDV